MNENKPILRKCTHCGKEYPDNVFICEYDAWPLFVDPSPLKITAITASVTRQYSQKTLDETLSALRADILQGSISREAKTTFETTAGNGKPKKWEGTLIECAKRYPLLADLYMPVRRQARAGIIKGILVGILISTASFGYAEYQTNQDFGGRILALATCWAILFSLVALRKLLIIQNLSGIISLVIIWSLGADGIVMLLGAQFAGGLLFSFPGMAIGAAAGAIRRPKLELAKDAPQESVKLRIIIPLVISIAIWATYLCWLQSVLHTQAKTVNVRPAKAHFISGLPAHIRYDGVYRCADDAGGVASWEYLRFYPIGTVGIIDTTGNPEDAIKLLEENHYSGNRGDVTISRSNLSFSTVGVDYNGEISGDLIQLRWRSHINENQATNVYEFVKCQPQ